MHDDHLSASQAPVPLVVRLHPEESRWLQEFCRRTGQDVDDLASRIIRRELSVMAHVQGPLPDGQVQVDCHACKGTGRLELPPS